MQAVKAPRREEDVAVCVVQLLPPDGDASADSQYLLIQRPSKGLLAGASSSMVFVLTLCLPQLIFTL